MIRLGILGCGRIAQLVHIRQFARLANVDIVAVADSDAQSLSSAAAMVPKALTFTRWQDLLAAGITDAVVVTLPPAMHADAAVAALASANHIYLEKPLALSLADGARILTAQAAAAKIAQIGLNFRYHPNYLDLRSHIAEGKLGDIVAMRSVFCSARRALPGWKSSRETGGSVLRELGVHHLDLVEFLLGEDIVAVSAVERSIDNEGDAANVIAKTRSGVSIAMVFALASGASVNSVEAFGTKGHLVADTSDARPRRVDGMVSGSARVARLRKGMARVAPAELLMTPGFDPSFAAAFAAFARSVQESKPAAPDLDVGLRALRLVLTAEDAAARGTLVDVQSN